MNSDTAPHQDILKQPTPDPGPLLAQQSASTSTHQTMSRRANLTKEGSAVLKEYLLDHPDDTHPTKVTRKSLLKQVQKAQNNPDIKLSSVSNWFQRRRSKIQSCQQQSGAPITPISPMGTTAFSEDNLRKLQTLAQATPEPNLDVLDTWASLFHVSLPVLQYAITVVLPSHFPPTPLQSTAQPRLSERDPPVTDHSVTQTISAQSQRLPTPSDSLTPEPAFAGRYTRSTEYLKDEITSPVLEARSLLDETSQRGFPLPTRRTPFTVPKESHLQLSPPLTPVVPTAKFSLPKPPETQNVPSPEVTTTLYKPSLADAIFSGVLDTCGRAAFIKNQLSRLPQTVSESDARLARYCESLQTLSYLLKDTPPRL